MGLRCGAACVLGLGQLDLHAVDAVDGVDEEDEDKDEGDFHAVLQLGDEGALGDEGEEGALPGEGQGDDEGHEDGHLQHQEGEDLVCEQLASCVTGMRLARMLECGSITGA